MNPERVSFAVNISNNIMKSIVIKLGTEKHYLVPLPQQFRNGCYRCTLNGVCNTMGVVSKVSMCDALIAETFDYPREEYPNGGYFIKQLKKK